MKVVFNVDAITAPLTGIGRYALELARGLARHQTIEDLRLYSAYQWVDDPAHALSANRTIAAVRRHVPFKAAALELYSLLRSGLFRLHTRTLHGYLLHTPNYVLMPFDGPAFTTIHDLSWLNFPQAHPRERVRFLERHLPRTLEQAACVLTDSQFIADEIVGKLALPRQKLRVVPLGVDGRFRAQPRAALLPVLSRYGLADEAYLLTVATQEPRKNLVRLLRAHAALPAALRARHRLVIAGGRGWLNADLEREISPLEACGQVRRLGYVDETDLPALYAGAYAFAFPSLYEGFGLPVLEAFASGVPSLTSSGSSLAEIARDTAGEIALCIEATDEGALRDGLRRLLEDDGWRAQAIPRGIAHASGFTWSACVDATVEAYRSFT